MDNTHVVERKLNTTFLCQGQEPSEKKLSMVDQMNSTVVIEDNLNRTVNLDDSMGYHSFKEMDNTNVVETSTTFTPQGQQTFEESTSVVESKLDTTFNLQQQAKFKASDENLDASPQNLTEIESFEQGTDSFDNTKTDLVSRHVTLSQATNSTADETFLSCNQSESSLVDEVIEISSDDEFETTESIEKSITENEHFAESVEEKLDVLNIAAAEVCPNDCKTTIFVEDMDSDILTKTKNSNKSEFLNNTEPASNRKSTGIIMSTMTFGMSPSPGKQNLSGFGNELYAELLAASPAVYDQKVADYDKYVTLKLEINDLQQTIAKLTIELKQKEAQILVLQPHKVNLPVRKASEDSKSLELVRALKTITILQAENDMYLDEVKQLKELLLEKKEINNNAEHQQKCEHLQAEVDRSQNEIEDVRKQNQSLKKNLEIVEELLISFRAKMHESEDVYTKKIIKINTTLDHVMDKYEKNKNALVNMQKILSPLQSAYYNLECDCKTLCLDYEAFKKSASERIAEANKENLKIKLEAESKGVVGKRPPLRDN